MAKAISEAEIAKMMTHLKISREEAIDVIESDRAIERGERMEFDLDKEKEKEVMKESHKGKKITSYNFTKRERKENVTKSTLIAELAEYLSQESDSGCEEVTIVKKEREISFSIGEDSYSLTLVQHRKPKS